MKKIVGALAVAALVGGYASDAFSGLLENASKFRQHPDFQTATQLIKRAERNERNILVTGTEWCLPCMVLERYAERLKQERGLDMYECGSGTTVIEVSPGKGAGDKKYKGLDIDAVEQALKDTNALRIGNYGCGRIPEFHLPSLLRWYHKEPTRDCPNPTTTLILEVGDLEEGRLRKRKVERIFGCDEDEK